MHLLTNFRLTGYFITTAFFFITAFIPAVVYIYVMIENTSNVLIWLLLAGVLPFLYLWAMLYFAIGHTRVAFLFLPKIRAGKWQHDTDDAKLYGVRLTADGIIKAMLGSIGFIPFINNKFLLKFFLRFYGLKCGKNVYLASSMKLDSCLLEIGDNCFFGQRCTISCHITESRYLEIKPVKIGDNVTIGGYTIVAPGSDIGDNVMIGVLSFVKKDQVLPSDSGIWAGVPVKIISSRKIPMELEHIGKEVLTELVGMQTASDRLPVIDDDSEKQEE
ncbi:MAG: acyltransferase [Candidatus Hodarchaeales archaeon]|jgi:acetyltransferase-like isoleucine patch superfamily enzyme